jgi:hypothetical protein
MKAPKYGAATMQAQSDARINPFAVTLIAESFADNPSVFGDETVMVVGYSHKGAMVYMLLSTQQPESWQFSTWPRTEDRFSPRQEMRAKVVTILAAYYSEQISIGAVEAILDAIGFKDEFEAEEAKKCPS